jgi:hypothetical protein
MQNGKCAVWEPVNLLLYLLSTASNFVLPRMQNETGFLPRTFEFPSPERKEQKDHGKIKET